MVLLVVGTIAPIVGCTIPAKDAWVLDAVKQFRPVVCLTPSKPREDVVVVGALQIIVVFLVVEVLLAPGFVVAVAVGAIKDRFCCCCCCFVVGLEVVVAATTAAAEEDDDDDEILRLFLTRHDDVTMVRVEDRHNAMMMMRRSTLKS